MTKTSARIAVVLPDLRAGGAERLHLHLAREWMARGCRVEFVLLRRRGELLSLLPAGAEVVDLNARRIRAAVPLLARHLRRTRPDVVLAAMWRVLHRRK